MHVALGSSQALREEKNCCENENTSVSHALQSTILLYDTLKTHTLWFLWLTLAERVLQNCHIKLQWATTSFFIYSIFYFETVWL